MPYAWLLTIVLLPSGAVSPSDPDAAVVAGRRALDRWRDYPWYDDAGDGVRRIELAPPPEPRARDDWQFGGGPSPLHMLIWTLIGALLLAVVWLLLRSFLQREPSAAGQPAEEDRGRIESLPFPVRPGKLDLLDQARRLYEQGDFRQAIIYLFSHELVQLDKRQLIRLAKGKTNRQYLREVASRAGLRAVVEQTMVVFEDVFFGNRELQRAQFESCWSRLDEFEQLLESAATVPHPHPMVENRDVGNDKT